MKMAFEVIEFTNIKSERLVIDLTNIDTMPNNVVLALVTMADVNGAIAGAAILPPNLPAGFAGIPNQLVQMQQQILQGQQQNQQQMQQQLQVMADDIARINNRASAMGDHPLIPLRVGANPPPVLFPVDLDSLRNLTNPSLNQCLQYYGLGVVGSVRVKRQRLAGHIGALRM